MNLEQINIDPKKNRFNETIFLELSLFLYHSKRLNIQPLSNNYIVNTS